MLYSIKVRTSLNDKHISGAERIVKKEQIPQVVKNLLERQNHREFDFSNVKIELLDKEPLIVEKSLSIKTLKFDNYKQAYEAAVKILHSETGISLDVIKKYTSLLYKGASPEGENLRGAMIVDEEGCRLEVDSFRGVRTVLVDFENREKVEKKLLEEGYTARTVDALALATKNLLYEDILAEFCISDDSDYTTGYIAVKDRYIRFSPLKPEGLDKGGRVYFVKKGTDIKKLYHYLQSIPVLIKDVST